MERFRVRVFEFRVAGSEVLGIMGSGVSLWGLRVFELWVSGFGVEGFWLFGLRG